MPLPYRPIRLFSASFPGGLLTGLLLVGSSFATAQEKVTITECHGIEDAIKRLACYDVATGKEMPAKLEVEIIDPKTANPALAEKPGVTGMGLRMLASLKQDVPGSRPSSLAERWDLDNNPDPGLFSLRPYKPMYFLLGNFTSKVNAQPTSPNPANQAATSFDLKKTEAKYQISFKAKVLDHVFADNGNLWFGYTQSSRWQIYNKKVSAAFRETDYEPEAIYTLPVDYSLWGWKLSMLGASFTHQSNGRALPASRSWNRLVGIAAFERGDWTVMVRPWIRVHEKNQEDDNPDITNYAGRGELLVIRTYGKQQFALTARHSLKGGGLSHGSLALDWGFPLYGYLKGHVQIFSGYGESLIDYNHKQTTFGFGISLIEWL